MNKFIETYKCNDCELEFSVSKSFWEQPSCPDCGEHLNVVETTDNK